MSSIKPSISPWTSSCGRGVASSMPKAACRAVEDRLSTAWLCKATARLHGTRFSHGSEVASAVNCFARAALLALVPCLKIAGDAERSSDPTPRNIATKRRFCPRLLLSRTEHTFQQHAASLGKRPAVQLHIRVVLCHVLPPTDSANSKWSGSAGPRIACHPRPESESTPAATNTKQRLLLVSTGTSARSHIILILDSPRM